MSDNSDPRPQDASVNNSAANPATSGHTQPTIPLPAGGAGSSSVPQAPTPQGPSFPAPTAHTSSGYATNGYNGNGYPATGSGYTGNAYGNGYANAPQQPTYQAQPQYVAGGHTTHPQYGAAFGAAAGRPAAATAPRPAKRKGLGVFAGALVAVAVVGLGTGLGGAWAGNQLWGGNAAATTQGPSNVTINNPDSVNAVTAVAAKVTPSVVTISATASTEAGTGSGVVLSKDGYVLTNTHVVTLGGETSDATLKATTTDGKIYNAKVVGLDPTYDLAVIKLEGVSDLTPISWGDSNKLNVGDQLTAIGAPLGLDDTVTTGIVSALNRSISIQSSAVPENSSGDTQQTDPNQQNNQNGPFQFDLPGQSQQQSTTKTISIAVVQTDAAINPGNSGGALVNRDGQVIGINVAIASTGSSSSSSSESGNIGVGFAIPSSVAHRVAEQLMSKGSATHGLLGASVTDATAEANATQEGALIRSTSANGAAEKAGLQAGDVVTGVGDVPIQSATDLTAQIRANAGGSTVKITYVRNGKAHDVEVTLGTM
ncbi:S1C family serine protease [Microbacterium gorillae]|uniref:S1C family serine protease n=1 Tax=Microbacterium gorillae TaxID=1231063 RepID=UPI0006932CFB|nr:trypsin-like peptidase domain-containing protein [Microbacterium gorillae]